VFNATRDLLMQCIALHQTDDAFRYALHVKLQTQWDTNEVNLKLAWAAALDMKRHDLSAIRLVPGGVDPLFSPSRPQV
jgi:hypothetical protein